jgi:hypothetical protein
VINRPIPPEALQAVSQLMVLGHDFDTALLRSVQSQPPRFLHLRFVEDVRKDMRTEMQGAVQNVILGAITMARGREELGLPAEDFVRESSRLLA